MEVLEQPTFRKLTCWLAREAEVTGVYPGVCSGMEGLESRVSCCMVPSV